MSAKRGSDPPCACSFFYPRRPLRPRRIPQTDTIDPRVLWHVRLRSFAGPTAPPSQCRRLIADEAIGPAAGRLATQAVQPVTEVPREYSPWRRWPEEDANARGLSCCCSPTAPPELIEAVQAIEPSQPSTPRELTAA